VYKPHIIIIGAGIIGLSTAYALLQQGQVQVTVLEQETVDHRRGSSHGTSRLLRFEYGVDRFYSEMVYKSLQRWQQLERQTDRQLYTATGILLMGNEHDNYTKPSYVTLQELGMTPEYLTPQACQRRFPQFSTQGYDTILYNINAGILHASQCLQTLKECIIHLGGTILEHHHVTRVDHDNHHLPITLHLNTGETLTAERLVIATGPWIQHLLEDLQLPVRVTCQYLLYFAGLEQAAFSTPAFPAFMADELYGFPLQPSPQIAGAFWLKAASHTFGAIVNPEEPLTIDQHVVNQIVRRLYTVIPALRHARLAEVEAYMYDVSNDEDFILDYHPHDQRIVLATGLSGHAFKFGLLLGEMVSVLVQERSVDRSLKHFQLTRFATHWQSKANSLA
jgi:monomeric sarcosine oxidase